MPTYSKTAHILYLDDKNQENMIGLPLAYIIFICFTYWNRQCRDPLKLTFFINFRTMLSTVSSHTASKQTMPSHGIFSIFSPWTKSKKDHDFFCQQYGNQSELKWNPREKILTRVLKMFSFQRHFLYKSYRNLCATTLQRQKKLVWELFCQERNIPFH